MYTKIGAITDWQTLADNNNSKSIVGNNLDEYSGKTWSMMSLKIINAEAKKTDRTVEIATCLKNNLSNSECSASATCEAKRDIAGDRILPDTVTTAKEIDRDKPN